MRKVIGIVLILAAIAGGLYFGGWVCFIQAIMEIIEAIKAGWIAKDIAIGIAKIVLGIPAVEIIAYFVGIVGMGLAIPGGNKKKKLE